MNVFEKIREKLQELCEQTYYNSVNGNRDEGIRNNAYHNAIEIVTQVEQEHNNGWIPIGQYPTEPSLLCFEDGTMAVGYYDSYDDVCINVGGCYYATKKEPIAWQPLPEAFVEK